MHFQAAVAEDLVEIRSLLEAASLPTDDVDEGLVESFIVLRLRGELVASGSLVSLGPGLGLLRSIVVRPSDQGGGLGLRVLQALETRAHDLGIEYLFLLTTTASPFFARNGYEVAQRADAPLALRQTRQFAELCPDSAELMSKLLQRPAPHDPS